MNKAWAVAKVNFKMTTWVAYLVAAIWAVAMIADMILVACLNNQSDSMVSYSMFYLVCVLAPILIASVNYSKLMNLGVKKKTYFWGAAINYVVFAAAVAALGTVEYYIVDLPYVQKETGNKLLNIIGVFGWDSSFVSAFFSQFAFLLLIESVLHTLTFMQTKWYGWAAVILIVAVISVFTPIAVLRQVEAFFFEMIIFSAPVLQVFICLSLAVLFYATNLFYLKKRI